MKHLIITIGTFIFSCGQYQSAEGQQPKPNIIFIMADDLGYGDVGVYGQKLIKTPNIDRLAAGGMKFTQFYAGSTVCAPSRSTLMTGLHTGHTEVRGNRPYGIRNGQVPLSQGTTTIATVLKQAGYSTAMMGKWGLGNPGTSGNPLNHGFDHFFGYTDQVLAHNYYPEFLWRNGNKVLLNNEVIYLDSTQWHKGLGSYSTVQNEYSQDLIMSEALDYIDKNKANSFFLYLPFTVPHDNGEQPDTMRYEVPEQGIYKEMNWTRNAKDYAAMITRMDSGIGQIISQLEKVGIDENTLVIFTSDNGPLNIRATDFFNSSGSLRGGKGNLYEGGIRAPFIAYWPGKIEKGSSSKFIGGLWDMLPTFAELAQQTISDKIDGISMVPTLLGEGNQKEHPSLYWEFHERNGSQVIRKGKWKAIRINAIRDPGNPVELYDLSEDLTEQNNLANQFPEKAKELDSLMSASRTHSDLFPLIR